MRATPVLLAAALALGAATAADAITLDDAVHFEVKKTWTAPSVGVPTPLGGLHFAAGGSTLYVVGGADTPSAQIYAIPVTRDPGTHEVTDLGVATGSFGSSAPGSTSGLDAGIEIGPAGTLFVAYFGRGPSPNALGERPGGPGGAEQQFTFAGLAGLTFSPLRTDPGTSFGRLHTSTGVSHDVFEIGLTPTATPGIFMPGGSPTLFVRATGDAVEGIQYVPAGTFQKNLLYAAFAAGELRLVTIDPATGLPVDAGTAMPTLGTTNPSDARFAHALGANGPIGLEFDAQTNDDLFVSTFTGGTPANTILRIAGFAGVFATTTTTTSTPSTTSTSTTTSSLAASSTTTSAPPTSTTTTAAPTTTTTALATTSTTTTSTTLGTLPSTTTTRAPTTTTLPAACEREKTFPSIACRLDGLLAAVTGSSELHPPRSTRLASRLARAHVRTDQAAGQVATGHRGQAKRSLARAARALNAFRAGLQAHAVPVATRDTLLATAGPLLFDLRALANSL